jgi:hypothetical protein
MQVFGAAKLSDDASWCHYSLFPCDLPITRCGEVQCTLWFPDDLDDNASSTAYRPRLGAGEGTTCSRIVLCHG